MPPNRNDLSQKEAFYDKGDKTLKSWECLKPNANGD